jgi:hypothetical protein
MFPADGVTANVEPVHNGLRVILVTNGVGFTYTVAENAAPEHSNPPLLYIGVTLYVAVWSTFVPLFKIPVNKLPAVLLPFEPVINVLEDAKYVQL